MVSLFFPLRFILSGCFSVSLADLRMGAEPLGIRSVLTPSQAHFDALFSISQPCQRRKSNTFFIDNHYMAILLHCNYTRNLL